MDEAASQQRTSVRRPCALSEVGAPAKRAGSVLEVMTVLRWMMAAALAAATLTGSASASMAQSSSGPTTSAAPVAGAPPAAAAAVSPSYLLGPGDHIRLTVFGEPDLSGEFQIGPSGSVALPLIGDVKAAGVTTADFQSALTSAYMKGLLVNPKVSVELLTFRPFFILGEVSKPGSYPYTSDLTVFNAVATAGGFTYRANQKWVYIRHANEEKETKTPLTSATPLAPGDTAIIKQRYF